MTAMKKNTRTTNARSNISTAIKPSPKVPARYANANCGSSRVVRAQVRYSSAASEMWPSLNAKAVFDDGPISLETAMYIETEIEKEWDDITLERFDAQVNLLVALRDKMFAIAVPGSERLVAKNDEEEKAA